VIRYNLFSDYGYVGPEKNDDFGSLRHDDLFVRRRNALPTAPLNLVATGGYLQADLEWDAPATLGAPELDDYIIQFTPPTLELGVAVPIGLNVPQVEEFEFNSGRPVTRVVIYEHWGDNNPVPTTALQAMINRGTPPVITWEPWVSTGGVTQPAYALDTITAGNHNTYIDTWANGLKTLTGTVYLRFAHEMNGNWYPWGHGVNGNGAGDYIAAYQYICDRFAAAAVTNVKFLWSPNVNYSGSPALSLLWPGASYVDEIHVDGYNWGASNAPNAWLLPAQIFDATFTEIATLTTTKPLWIGETGCHPTSGNKAEWFRHLFAWAQSAGLAGLVYFNYDKETDWRIESSPDSLSGFREAASGSGEGIITFDTFNGVDGDDWAKTIWAPTSVSGSASASLFSNRGRLSCGTTGGYADSVRKRLLGVPQTGHRRIRGTFQCNQSAENYVRIHFNSTADTGTGYMVEFGIWSTGAEIKLMRRVGFSDTTLGTASFPFGSTQWINFVIEWNNSFIRVKAGQKTGSLSQAWLINVTDTTYTSGNVHLEVQNGAAATAVDVDFDTFSLHSVDAIGASGPWQTVVEPIETTPSSAIAMTKAGTFSFRVAARNSRGLGSWVTSTSTVVTGPGGTTFTRSLASALGAAGVANRARSLIRVISGSSYFGDNFDSPTLNTAIWNVTFGTFAIDAGRLKMPTTNSANLVDNTTFNIDGRGKQFTFVLTFSAPLGTAQEAFFHFHPAGVTKWEDGVHIGVFQGLWWWSVWQDNVSHLSASSGITHGASNQVARVTVGLDDSLLFEVGNGSSWTQLGQIVPGHAYNWSPDAVNVGFQVSRWDAGVSTDAFFDNVDVRNGQPSVIGPTGATLALKVILRAFAGALGFSGATARARTAVRAAAGAISPGGVVARIKNAFRVFASTSSSAGAVRRDVQTLESGVVAGSGVASRARQLIRSHAGSLSSSALLGRAKVAGLAFVGTLAPSAVLGAARNRPRAFFGAVAPAGAFVGLRVRLLALTASVSPGAVIVRLASLAKSGQMNPAAILTSVGAKFLNLAGATNPASVLARTRARFLTLFGAAPNAGVLAASRSRFSTFAGALGASGSLARIASRLRSLSGTFSPAGVAARTANYNRVIQSALPSSGVLGRAASTVRSLSAALGTSGSVTAARSRVRALAGSLASSGVLVAAAARTRALAGSVASSAVVTAARTRLVAVAASISSTGAATRSTARRAASALSFQGAFSYAGAAILQLSSSLGFTGAATRVASLSRSVSGFVSSLGVVSLVRSRFASVAGSLAPVGAASLVRSLVRALVGALNQGGFIARQIRYVESGTLSQSGSVRRIAARILEGSIGSAGSLARGAGKNLAATSSLAGSLVRNAFLVRSSSISIQSLVTLSRLRSRALSGSIAITGMFNSTRVLIRSLAGQVSGAGIITTALARARSLGATLTPVGVSAVAATKYILTSGQVFLSAAISGTGGLALQVGGFIAPAGTARRQTLRAAAATLASVGVTSRFVARAFSSALPAVGVVGLVRGLSRVLSSALSPSGVATRAATFVRTAGASVGMAGVVGRTFFRLAAGSVTASGAAVRLALAVESASIAASGTAVRVASLSRSLGAVFQPTGATGRLTSRSSSGALTPTSTFGRFFDRVVGGAMSMSGAIPGRLIEKAVTALLGTLSVLGKLLTVGQRGVVFLECEDVLQLSLHSEELLELDLTSTEDVLDATNLTTDAAFLET
jgi:hypothetical protein